MKDHHHSRSFLRVLICEDQREITDLLSEELRRIGCLVAGIASSGEVAVEMARETRPDLVLMDVSLHGTPHGVEAARTIGSLLGLPVVYLLCGAEYPSMEDVLGSNPYGFLTKPFGGFALRAALEAAVSRHKQEQRLKQSESLYRAVFETVPVPMFIKDCDLTYRQINPAMERLLGVQSVEVIGKTDKHFFGEGVGEICKSVDISVLAGEIVEREPTVSVKGVPTEFHVCKAPVNDSAGQVTGIVGTATDVTQRKRTERALRESEKRYRALFDGSRDGIYVVSRDGAVLDANESFLNIFGYDREEMLQLNAINLYCDPADRRRFQDDIELTGSVKDYEIRMLRKDGTPIVCQATSAVRRDEAGRTIQYQGIVRDVTERKMVEEELQRVRADLERRVEERTAELKDANEHLRAEIARRTQAQELLKQNEAHCRALLSAVPDPVVVYDPTGKVTYVNDAFTETYGWTSEELLGKTIDFVPPGETEKTLNALERILGGEKVLLETTRFTKDGRLLHLHLVAAALRNADGKISETIVVHRDVSNYYGALHQLRESEERYRSVMDAVPYPIVVYDVEGRVTYLNQAFARAFGWKLEELIGQRIDYVPEDCLSETQKMIERTMQGLSVNGFETRRYTKSGELINVSLSADVFRNEDGIPVGSVAAMQNITERKRAEKQLEEALAVASDLRIAAETANRAKSEFLTNMSHELRTPLNAVIGFSEILKDETFGELNTKQLKYVRHILNSGRHLLHLINDILDLAKVESGKMEVHFSQVNVRQWLSNSLILIREKAQKHQLALDLRIEDAATDLVIMADEVKLKQIMFNLLSNATKFTPDGGRIEVEARILADELLIRVSDTGIGVKPEDHQLIFAPFQQVDSSYARKQQGTGLGLALTRQLVQLHRGRIWVESAGPGTGSSFIMTIPIVAGHDRKREVLATRMDAAAWADAPPTGSAETLDDSWIQYETITAGQYLPGFWSRSAVRDMLEKEIGRATREESALSLMVVEIHDLDQITDRHGVLCAHDVLYETGRRILELVRQYDHVGLHEENKAIVVLLGCDRESGERTLERVHAALCAVPVTASAGDFAITPKLGLSTLEKYEDVSAASLIHAAEKDLRARNRRRK